jgi:hypothetical protein
MAKHKWHTEIIAWADGEEIQSRPIKAFDSVAWEVDKNPSWNGNVSQFRIKLQSKEPKFVWVYRTAKGLELGGKPHPAMNMNENLLIGKIEVL